MESSRHKKGDIRSARRVIPGGVNSGQRRIAGIDDLVVVGSDGATITDSHGRIYTDYHAAFGPVVLGHADPDVIAAVSKAANVVDLVGVGVTPFEIELAERLVELVPSIEQVLLTSSGSEATFQALRLARAATGRKYILKFQGCYHGWHDSVALNVISPRERLGRKDPLSTGILGPVLSATKVCPFNDAEAVGTVLRHGDVAAVIIEPIPHNIGCVLPQPGFLEEVRKLCDAHGTVLIFDEVVTGFRHALGGYQSVCEVTPDLTCLGKAMGNGYPIAALGGRTDLMELFSTTPGRPVFFAGTYNGHPAMAAAALATIAKLEREPVYEHIFRLGERARTGLASVVQDLGISAVVSGFGSVFVTYFLEPPVERYDDLLRNDAQLFCSYRLELLRHGIFELPLNLKRSHISYAHREKDVDTLVTATADAVTRAIGQSERRALLNSA